MNDITLAYDQPYYIATEMGVVEKLYKGTKEDHDYIARGVAYFTKEAAQKEIEKEPEGHVHAEKMALYAKDAETMKNPWETWEFRSHGCPNWNPCTIHPSWSSASEYRRKPSEITVNGIQVPAPERSPLELYTKYYLASPVSERPPHMYWQNAKSDFLWLNRGILHLSEEAAVKHMEAMIA